jgi:hypothetical protein
LTATANFETTDCKSTTVSHKEDEFMKRVALSLSIFAALVGCIPAFAVDGVVLINQASVLAAGGFPLRITAAGSYKLTGNLVVPDGADGIDIAHTGVTLDLNGFSIIGPVRCDIGGLGCPPSPSGNGNGIFYSKDGVTIQNGNVTGFDIGVQGSQAIATLEDLHVIGNARFGILTSRSLVRRNDVSRNGGLGIACNQCVVLENLVISNVLAGVNLGEGIFGSNVVESNGAPAFIVASVVSQHNNSCDTSTC